MSASLHCDHIVVGNKMVSALRWAAAALQAQGREQDVVTIGAESKTVWQILDQADEALGGGKCEI